MEMQPENCLFVELFIICYFIHLKCLNKVQKKEQCCVFVLQWKANFPPLTSCYSPKGECMLLLFLGIKLISQHFIPSLLFNNILVKFYKTALANIFIIFHLFFFFKTFCLKFKSPILLTELPVSVGQAIFIWPSFLRFYCGTRKDINQSRSG